MTIGPLPPTDSSRPVAGAAAMRQPPVTATTSGTAPAADGPPPHVLAEIDRATAVVDRLARAGIELRFDADPTDDELRVEVRDRTGAARAITPSAALDVAAGRAAPLDAKSA